MVAEDIEYHFFWKFILSVIFSILYFNFYLLSCDLSFYPSYSLHLLLSLYE